MKITMQTKICDILELAPWTKYLMYGGDDHGHPIDCESPESIHKAIPAWSGLGIHKGLQRLCDVLENGSTHYKIYSEDECMTDPQKADIGFFDFPAVKGTEKENAPFIIVAAGGGYDAVCSMIEAFPTAACFNELGYHCFVINYRVGGFGVLPKPLEDVAAILRYLAGHSEKFHINADNYVMCGFSAGANLTSLWGTESAGWKYYNLPKPKALFPIYTVVDFTHAYNTTDGYIEKVMFGENYTNADIKRYNFPEIFTPNYPPCYLVHGQNDSTVPVQNSIGVKEMLEKHGIPVEFQTAADAEHGFGCGLGTEVEGWPANAIRFLESL